MSMLPNTIPVLCLPDERWYSSIDLVLCAHVVVRYAQVRRGGQVQEAREKTAGYGGEATGIKAKVSKSRRF